jgi:alpha-maltose-1-phosphate synthase
MGGLTMQVIQAVFGVFHHFELAHQLRRRGHLRRIYSTWPWTRIKREDLPRSLVSTFPIVHTTEYLLNRTGLYMPALASRFNRWNSITFDDWTYRNIEPCDAFVAISGAGLTTGPLVQSRGGKFICDRGSTHQRFQENIMAEEYARWKLPPALPMPHIAQREEQIYDLADAITVASNAARRSFIEMGVPAHKVHVIPYGVRLDRFAPAKSPPKQSQPSQTFEVLFAGQISLRKGIPYLLQAFARLRHPHKRLTLVGSMQHDMRGLMATLPTENVVLTGSISQASVAERMRLSHVLVLPSVEEGLGLVQSQAMATGCPVIASAATGAEDLFTDGVEGFIVPNRDPAALADRLQQLADDPILQKQMSAAALARVKLLGGWDHYGDQWDTLLHTLTGQPKSATEPD